MLHTIWNLYGYIALIIVAAVIIIGNILYLWYFIKCIGVKNCPLRKCKFHEYCFRYKEAWTKEDIEHIENLIEQL